MVEIGYDAKKMPLGKLSANNIKKGMTQLTKIAKLTGARGTKKYSLNKLDELCEEFYSYIPHDFGFQKMSNFRLNTPKKVKTKPSQNSIQLKTT